MDPTIYTKNGTLRKTAPPRYVFRSTQEPVPNKHLQHIKLPGITFVVGPNGERLDENPAYKQWVKLINERPAPISTQGEE